VVICTDCTGSCVYNFHTITTTAVLWHRKITSFIASMNPYPFISNMHYKHRYII
jgi:hypothetical protein